jgi:hypothetical protein
MNHTDVNNYFKILIEILVDNDVLNKSHDNDVLNKSQNISNMKETGFCVNRRSHIT